MSENLYTPDAAARFHKRVRMVKADRETLRRTQVIELAMRFPEYRAKDIARLMHFPVTEVRRHLRHEDAQRRLSEARDISPFLARAAVKNTVDSMLLTGKAVRKARVELDKERPNAAVLQAGMKGAGDTLTGFGVYKQKIDVRDSRLSSDDVERVLRMTEELERQLVGAETTISSMDTVEPTYSTNSSNKTLDALDSKD